MKIKLQEIRWEKELTQQQLAIKSGVRRDVICKIENGNIKNPSVEVALKLSRALNVEIEEIFKLD